MTTTDPSTSTTALPRSRPEDEGVPPGALEAVLDRWRAAGVEAHGLVVLRRGRVVAEASWEPYRPDGIQLVYSVSKTFTACAVGLAEAEGLLRLDERLVDVFPEHAHRAGPRAARLTLHDVLTMTTGHHEDTLVWRDDDLEAFPGTFLAAEPEAAPGTHFVYHNGATLVAALAVQRRAGTRLLHYLRPRLLDPLGVGPAAWLGDGTRDAGYSGIHVRTEALARLGELLRRDGVRAGRRLLPEGWVERMTTPHADTRAHGDTADWRLGYGYQVWRSQHDGFRADGAFGQFALVCPAAELVVAVTSCSDDTQALLDAVWDELLPALTPGPLPRDDGAHTRLADRLAGARLEPARSRAEPVGDGPWELRHVPSEDHPELRGLRVSRTDDPRRPWRLELDDGGPVVLTAGDGAWPDDDSPWAASAGWSAPDAFEARVVATQTPHVLHLTGRDGTLTARWNGRPLGRPSLAALRAPEA